MSTDEADHSQFFKDLYALASTELETTEKINQAIDIGRRRLGLQYGVLSYTGEGTYEIVQTNITSGKYAPGSVSELEETWCRHVVNERQLIAFDDADKTEYSDDVAKEATGLHCYIGAPILIDGEAYGTLCYSDDDPRADEFAESEERFVTLLSDWIGYELERNKHHHELRKQNERLDEFTGVVAHDLRNPLAGAIGYTELAVEQTSGEVHEFLKRVDRSLDRMDSLIGECLVLAKQGTDVGQRVEVNLASVANAAWETVRTGSASVDIDADLMVYADEMRLQRLFENLFRNVAEHCQDDVSVTITDRQDGFAISDDGPGLPNAVSEALASSDADEVKNLGLGLLIVQRVVSGHGWTLDVNAGSDGTTFIISGINTAGPTHRDGDPS